jgi:hypothetical protein
VKSLFPIAVVCGFVGGPSGLKPRRCGGTEVPHSRFAWQQKSMECALKWYPNQFRFSETDKRDKRDSPVLKSSGTHAARKIVPFHSHVDGK